jgi:hypothetical protein
MFVVVFPSHSGSIEYGPHWCAMFFEGLQSEWADARQGRLKAALAWPTCPAATMARLEALEATQVVDSHDNSG